MDRHLLPIDIGVLVSIVYVVLGGQ